MQCSNNHELILNFKMIGMETTLRAMEQYQVAQ